ncbi:hypothetical protein AJ78_07173 [Emergomyces pasteurianus Ep9510]|uniref:Uncharacterized protein n=1 Tax=Emergomyces pasteurianus Ep9510 TaxID=1447872 RepID=A0A1J9P7V9_9EURO|nr:hypothetical protein AJ78_07173 [Emergomyces pasteurianus Ep9510]
MTPSAITSSTPHLSSNDSAVLQALFDAESSPSNASAGIHLDSSLPQQLPGISPAELSRLQAQELAAIALLQGDAVQNAETIRTAVSKLTAIIDGNQQYASAYVNRAQALRMLVECYMSTNSAEEGEKMRSEEQQEEELANMIFADLSTAITLLTPSLSMSSSLARTISISPLHSRILANAHTHRAYILYRAARSMPTSTSASTSPLPRALSLPHHLRSKSPQQLEEMASMDFQLGGRYGNDIARQMAVQTNPYAKMCGAIVKEAMRKEMTGGMADGKTGGFVV